MQNYIDTIRPDDIGDMLKQVNFGNSRYFQRVRINAEDIEEAIQMLASHLYTDIARDVFARRVKKFCDNKCACCSKHTNLQLAHGILDRPTLVNLAYKKTPVIDGQIDVGMANILFVILHVFSPPVAMCEPCHRQWDTVEKDKLATYITKTLLHEIDVFDMWQEAGEIDDDCIDQILVAANKARNMIQEEVKSKSKLLMNWERIQKRRTTPKTTTKKGLIRNLLKTGKVDLKRAAINRSWTAMHRTPIRWAMRHGGFKLAGKQVTFGLRDELRGQRLDPFSPESIKTHLAAVEKYPQSKTQGNGYFRAALNTLLLVHTSM